MSRYLKIGAPLILILAFGTPGYSADNHFMIPEEDTLELILLRQKSVRDELKISSATEEQVRKHAAHQWKKAGEISSLSEAEQNKKYEEMGKENRAFLKKHLTSQQLERLDEIALQVAGLLYVTRSDIAAKLKLTNDQILKAKQLRKDARAELEKLLEFKQSETRHKEIVALWQVNHERLEKLLTESQRTNWKQMTGAEFKGEFTYSQQ